MVIAALVGDAGCVLGLDAKTGVQRWVLPGSGASAFSVSDGYAYGSVGGVFTAVSLATGLPALGGVIWGSSLVNQSPPLLAHGRLYVMDYDVLTCFG